MGKTLKEFFSSPKKTAILGLIGAIISILYYIIIQQIDYNYLDYFDFGILVYFILYNISIIGLIVYFSIVLMRITKKTGNIQVANILLIVSFVIQTIFSIFRMYGGVITTILYIIIIIYLCSILLKTKKTISNKIFIISPIGFILLSLYGGFESGSMIYKASQAMSIFNIGDTITSYWNVIKYMLSYSFYYISYLFMIPYFYNYYNLLKGGNKNGK